MSWIYSVENWPYFPLALLSHVLVPCCPVSILITKGVLFALFSALKYIRTIQSHIPFHGIFHLLICSRVLEVMG